MVSRNISYEESLEEMNEEGLRRECVRLHEQLMIATKKLLTQPVPDSRSKEAVQTELEELIEEKRREYHDDSDTYVLETEFS